MENNFLDVLKKQVIVIDGAMGTMVQDLFLPDIAFGGKEFAMLTDLLVFSRPEEIKNIHIAYYKSGSNCVETNTFGASPLRLAEFNFKNLDTSDFPDQVDGAKLQEIDALDFCYRMNKQAAEIACRAKEEFRNAPDFDGRPLYVLGSIGPSNWVLSSTKANLNKGTYEQIEDNFYQQVLGLIDGGADVLLFETQQDILELKVAVFGAQKAMEEKGVKLPIIAQVTVDQFSKMQIFNTDIQSALTTVQDIGIDVFGINCSIGPDLMIPTVKKISQFSTLPISIIPNAGLPVSENGKTVFKLSPEELSEHVKSFVTDFGVNIVGGCCGTNPEHIKAIAKKVKGIKPIERTFDKGLFISGPQEAIRVDGSESLIRIGERLNVRGSKKVREAVERDGAINQEALEEVVQEQVSDLGVPIIDVCMDSNVVDTSEALVAVIKEQTIDFAGAMCIDSFDVEALEEAIKIYPGRPIINSISLEEYKDGVDKIDAVLEKTAHHSPVYICLCTGPKGPAATADDKVDLARQIVEKVQTKYGVPPRNLMIDMNGFPIGSESDENMNFALESLNSIQRIKEEVHEDLMVSLGVGNLTNGLGKKPYMRKLLTSIFLDEGRKRGLDAAIVNPNHYVPVESLDQFDYELGLKVIFDKDMDAFEKLEEIAHAKSGQVVKKKSNYDELEIIESVCAKIYDGFKKRVPGTIEVDGYSFEYIDTIVLQVAEIIKDMNPLTLINDHLMASMKKLGDGFGEGIVSLPHLLKSADVMKQVMSFLEKFMKRKSGADIHDEIQYKGTIILGTVYQDVHSIGKDLAKTLLENYGYRVIDLGVQVPLESFVSNAKEYNADAIGMSALLVQTSNHMITVSSMLKKEGIDVPILIGGAPVNHRHAGYVAMADKDNVEVIKEDVFYCASAMDGVNIMNALMSPTERDKIIAENKEKLISYYLRAVKSAEEKEELLGTLPRREILITENYPKFQDFKAPIHFEISTKGFAHNINLKNLFSLNWKYGGRKSWEKKGMSQEKLEAQFHKWVKKSDENNWIKPQAVYGLFPCKRTNINTISIFHPEDRSKHLGDFSFNNVIGHGKKDIFSVSQFFHDNIEEGYIGLQVSTAGPNVDHAIQKMKGEDQESAMLLQGLSDRIAEDVASYCNNELNIMVESKGLRSIRYSPGYPGMTELKNNELIATALNAVKALGIEMTEAYEFYPTGTTAAIVCFHEKAGYQ